MTNFAHDVKIDPGTQWCVISPTDAGLHSHRSLMFQITDPHARDASAQLGGAQADSVMYAAFDGHMLEVAVYDLGTAECDSVQFDIGNGEQVIIRQINDFVFKNGGRCPFGWTDVVYLLAGAPHHSEVKELQAA